MIPPKNSEPVSPINTLAGWKLYLKNPKHDPKTVSKRIPISEYPLLKAIIDNPSNIILETHPFKPSTPSVKFTALVTANKTNTEKIKYNQSVTQQERKLKKTNEKT